MNIFKNLFSKKATLQDFAQLGTDMHSHLIPGIDDGVKTVEESVAIITELNKMGFKKFYTTPHIMEDFYKNSKENILPLLGKVQAELKNQNIDVFIDASAEYYVDNGLYEKLEKKEILPLAKKYLLFEYSYINRPHNMKEIIFEMKMAGYTPILAHPERYTFFHDTYKDYRDLKDFEVLFQLNIGSLANQYSPQIQNIAEKLIDDGMIDFLGTDCHNMRNLNYYKGALNSQHLYKLINSGSLLNEKL